MKKSIINRSLSLVFAPLLLSAGMVHAAQVEAYYLVEEIPIEMANGLAEANSSFNVTAVSEDGEYVAGNALTFRSPFRFYDFSDRTSFDYGCQYAVEVCDLFFEGDNSFYGTYRHRLFNQASVLYKSNVLAFIAQRNVTGAHLNGTNSEIPTWDTVNDKLFIFDDSSQQTYTTDTRVNRINSSLGWAVGYDSAPFSNGSSSVYTREFIQRGFALRLSDDAKITLLPTPFSSDGQLSSDKGGVSSGLQVIQKDGKTLVIGLSSVSYSNSDSFGECQTGDQDYYYRCSGFNTQAWVWDITNADDGDAVEGVPLVEGYVRSQYGDAPNYNFIKDYNSHADIFVGISSDDVYDSTVGSRGRAVFYSANDDGSYSLNQIPNINIGGDSADFEDSVSHTWANAVNDAELMVGNLRYTQVKSRNRPVEAFVYDNDQASSSYQQVVWPLRDLPFNGANSEFSDINNDNLIVGWVDADGEEQPSYSGTTRWQSAILLDFDRYKNGESTYNWSLNSLTCYEQDGQPRMPLYRIEYASQILDDGTVYASGYHYETPDDLIHGVNPRPVLLRLERNPVVTDINDIASCPMLEEASYERQGAGVSWFGLLLLPLIYVRRFKKR
ncbi:DUF3466 family protein [Agarivorans sp. QJM3NY_29]|uniref:DUF3466 family protein n=1 Tax=unclassified Agarivorans TaxID=2636026 RepID=UPI003D7C5683